MRARLVRWLLLPLWVAACGPPRAVRCRVDADCPPGQACFGAPAGACAPGLRSDGEPVVDGGGLFGEAMPGDLCQTAVPVAAGTTLGQTTVGYANDYAGAVDGVERCTGSDRGPDRAYSVTVPAGMRLAATVAPAGDGGAYDPSIKLVRGPASSCDLRPPSCLAADDTGPASQPNTVYYTNETPSAETVFVIVDSYDSGGPGGLFDLTVALDSPPEGDSCGTAEAIGPAGGTLSGQTTSGFGNRYAWGSPANGCTASMAGRDRAFAVVVPAGQQLSATVTPAAGFDPSVYLVAGPASRCEANPLVCLASADRAGDGQPETVRYVNESAADLPLFVVVDSRVANAGGSFDLAVSITAIPPGESCASAEVIAPGTLTRQSTAGMWNDYAGASSANRCTSSDQGLDRVYRVEVLAGVRLTASVAPEADDGYDPSITLVAGPVSNCGASPRVCLAADDHGAATQRNVVQHTNTGPSAQSVFIVIDNWNPADAGGGFELSVALETPPTGDRCDDATPVTAGTLTGQTTAGFTNDYTGGSSAGGCTTGTAGPDRVYAVEVPNGQLLAVTLSPATGYDPSLYLVRAPAVLCDASPRTCIASASDAGAGEPETARYFNRGPAIETVFAVVDSASEGGGMFDIGFALSAPPPGEICELAEPLSGGSLAGQTTVGYANDYGPGAGCAGTEGPDRAYVVSVPSGSRLTATVMPDPGFDASLSLALGPATSCGAVPRVCLASSDARGPGGAEMLVYTNRSATEREVFAIVDSRSATGGAFSLMTATAPAPPPLDGDTCANATAITPGSVPGTTAGYEADHDPGRACTGVPAPGRDCVYALQLRSGERLTATVIPEGTFDPSLYLVRGPADCEPPIACLAGSDAGGAGSAETVSYENASGGDEVVFVVVDSYRATDDGGAFTLVTRVEAP